MELSQHECGQVVTRVRGPNSGDLTIFQNKKYSEYCPLYFIDKLDGRLDIVEQVH